MLQHNKVYGLYVITLMECLFVYRRHWSNSILVGIKLEMKACDF